MDKPKQTPEERARLMEEHKAHDEETTGVRPDLVIDTTLEDSNWLRDPSFWRKPDDEPDTP